MQATLRLDHGLSSQPSCVAACSLSQPRFCQHKRSSTSTRSLANKPPFLTGLSTEFNRRRQTRQSKREFHCSFSVSAWSARLEYGPCYTFRNLSKCKCLAKLTVQCFRGLEVIEFVDVHYFARKKENDYIPSQEENQQELLEGSDLSTCPRFSKKAAIYHFDLDCGFR
jgi:hypothetical protein